MAMTLTFTKREGKMDELVIRRDGRSPETVRCPKQGILPHDMVHYAVESVLAHRGFLSLVDEGQAVAFAMAGDDGEEAVERLVEVFQAEMWGGRIPAADLIATYEHACGVRGHAVSAISGDDVDAVRARLDDLARQWSGVATNESLVLQF